MRYNSVNLVRLQKNQLVRSAYNLPAKLPLSPYTAACLCDLENDPWGFKTVHCSPTMQPVHAWMCFYICSREEDDDGSNLQALFSQSADNCRPVGIWCMVHAREEKHKCFVYHFVSRQSYHSSTTTRTTCICLLVLHAYMHVPRCIGGCKTVQYSTAYSRIMNMVLYALI